MDYDIHEIVIRLNNEETLRAIAKELFGEAKKESTLRGQLKRAGYIKNEEGKYIMASSSIEVASGFEEDKLTQKGTNERKSTRTKERNHDRMKEQEIKPTNKEEVKRRKRASFDIDEKLLKELKVFAIMNDKNVYELVENAIRRYLREGE